MSFDFFGPGGRGLSGLFDFIGMVQKGTLKPSEPNYGRGVTLAQIEKFSLAFSWIGQFSFLLGFQSLLLATLQFFYAFSHG